MSGAAGAMGRGSRTATAGVLQGARLGARGGGWVAAGVILVGLFALEGCGDPADPLPMAGIEEGAVLRNGNLTVSGDAGPNDIRLILDSDGLVVDLDGQTKQFTDFVGSIAVTAGAGNDIVRLSQLAVASLDLTVGAGDGDDQVFLSLEPAGETDDLTVAAALETGAGSDVLSLSVDYSAVTAPQGRIVLDADLGGGDNRAEEYVRTLATPTSVGSSIRAGDGNNVLDLEHVLGGDGDHTFALDVGEGDNRATIRFGDGERGARPSSGQRNVTATYRSGSGRNAVQIQSEIVEPLSSSVSLDYGGGEGTTTGRYKLRFPWETQDPSNGEVQPSQVEVAVLSPSESALDLGVDVGDPEVDDPAALGAVSVQAAAVRQTDFDFIHERATTTGATGEQQWSVGLQDTRFTGDAQLVVDGPPGLERMVYLQDATDVAAGKTLSVVLRGETPADAVLAHLLGITGSGRYELLAEGLGGSDLLALLARDLLPGPQGEMTFDVTGGDNDDVLGVDVPPGLDPAGPIQPRIAAGPGTDACFGPQEVPVTDCERHEPIGQEFLSLIESTFGDELARIWSQ